jgi:tRNA pseudouridine38-40 synthase
VELPAEAHAIPEEKIAVAINTRLPRDIRIRAARLLEAPFHARFDAVSREYEYHITMRESVFTRRFAWTPELPWKPELLAAAGTVFVGRHDFTTFSKLNEDTDSYVCTVQECTVLCSPFSVLRSPFSDVVVRIRADRFVYGMCRSIVGAMMSVARGRRTKDEIAQALAAMERSRQEVLVPPHGLVLAEVVYPTSVFG